MKNPLKPITLEITPFELAIVARGTARLTVAELAAMRKQPPAGFPPKLSPLFLKHSDEQTLAALSAVYRAKADFGLDGEDFGPWAAVSISRYLGRGAFASLVDRYKVDGAWGVSVQVIPHRTAHSVSGTISLGLGMHGPCIGANGGADGENTGLLALPCIMQERQWRGVWLVCSNWSPEVAVDPKGQVISDSACLATALALVHADHPNPLGHVRFEPMVQGHCDSSAGHALADCACQRHATAKPGISLLEYIFDESDHGAWLRYPGNGLRIEIDLTVPAGVPA
jgi:hypothetical protein